MKEIIAWLFIWLGTNTYLNTDHPHPEVVFMPQEEMNALYYQDNDHEPDSLHGLYNKEEDTFNYTLILGGNINGGIIGEYNDLSKLWNNNINYKIDYRSLYDFILREHFNIKNNPFSQFNNKLIV